MLEDKFGPGLAGLPEAGQALDIDDRKVGTGMADDRSVNQNYHRRSVKSWRVLSDMPPSSCGVVRDLHGDAYFISVLASRGLTVGAEAQRAAKLWSRLAPDHGP